MYIEYKTSDARYIGEVLGEQLMNIGGGGGDNSRSIQRHSSVMDMEIRSHV